MPDETSAMLERLRPAVFPDSISRSAFAFQHKLAASQWLAREKLEQRQLELLKQLVSFAAREAPFWRKRLSPDAIERAGDLTEAMTTLPVLSRSDVRDHKGELRSANLPDGHQFAGERSSSGSTGMMVTISATNIALAVHHALTFRGYLWAGCDFERGLAVIRRQKQNKALYPKGAKLQRWGPRLVFPVPTGPAFHLTTLNTSLDEQWEWLGRVQPSYLLTYPSVARALAERAAQEGDVPASLDGITTIGELVDDELRMLSVKHLRAPLQDIYTSEEAGVMALQCPDSDSYHVQSESVIIEIVDEHNRACAPGEMGRVLVTTLMNYATPLLRYDIGDFAQVGSPCACGRGLPVLSRILGRRRNMLTLSDGRKFWPSFGARFMQKIVPITEHQFRQTALDVLEVWLVTENDILPAQETELRKIVAASLPAPLEIQIRRVPGIPRPASGKHEEFMSLIGAEFSSDVKQ